MTTPPLTPRAKALKGVLRLSGFHGWGVVVVSGLSLLITLFFFEPIGLMVSALVLAGGTMELRGRTMLKRRAGEAGMRLLRRAHLLILAVILAYCARCLGSFDAGYLKEEVIPEANQILLGVFGINLNDFLAEGGMTADELVPLAHQMFIAMYGTVAVVSLVVQGGVAFYYRSRTHLVIEALATPPQPPLA